MNDVESEAGHTFPPQDPRERGESSTSAIAPLSTRAPVAQMAAERIREAILRGSLAQGERLSDAQIAKDLGTSRGPIREALRLLEAEGLVQQKTGRGTFVTSISSEDLRDNYELRVALECHSARLLARSHDRDSLSDLYDLCERMDSAAEADDQLTVSQLDRAFHEHLCRLAGSRRLYEVFEREVLNMLTFSLFDFDYQAYQPIRDMGREFRPLLEAIEAGDVDGAARRIEEHIKRATELLSAQIESAFTTPSSL